LKKGERIFEHNDTFKRLFSVEQSKSVQLPRNKYNNNLITVRLEKYLLMKSNHINDLLERQKM
jgi:hypothetical protein